MAALYIMCGLAFAGKTTVARALAGRLDGAVVSLDEINAARGLRSGEGVPVEEWERSHRVAAAEADALLARGTAVVIDDTGCFRWLRERYREGARRRGHDVVVVFVDAPEAEARRRLLENAATGRRHGVRVEVFDAHARSFEPPDADEPAVVFGPGDELGEWLDARFPRRS